MPSIEVAGGRLETLSLPGDGPPLVLLHEGLGSVRLWRDFPAALAEALEVLPEVLEALGIEEPTLVGHSDGASIALIYAASHPVRRMVAIAPHVFVEQICLDGIRLAKRAYEQEGLRERISRHHRDVDAAFYGWNDVWLHPDFPQWSIEDVLDEISCPLLLIQGEHDQYGTMAQLDAVEQRVRGPVQRLHVDARHAPHLEAPEATLQAIAAFVTA